MAQPYPNLPNIRAWCDRFPKPIACIAMMLASMGRSTGSIMKRVFAAKAKGWNPLVRDPTEWLELYRSLPVLLSRLRSLESVDPSFGVVLRLIDSIRTLVTVQDPHGQAAEKAFSDCLECLFSILHEENLVEVAPAIQEGHGLELREDMKEPLMAALFVMTVVMPCLVQYRTFPARLITRARRGDMEAVRALVQIDDVVISDPRINRHFYADKNGPVVLRESLTTTPKIASDDQWKARMAVAIHEVSKELKIEMRHEDIIDLYHAIATDCGRSARGDESIKFIDPRSFERRANREKKFWSKPSDGLQS